MSRSGWPLVLLLAWLFSAGVAAAAEDATPAAKEKELKALKARIERLKREIDSSDKTRADVLDELRQSEQAISAINRKLHELDQALAEAGSELSIARQKARDLEARIATQRAELARLLLAQYQQGAPDAVRLLLNQQDPNQLARDMVYYGHIARAQARLITALRADLSAARQAAEDIQEKSENLSRLKAEQRAQRQALEAEATRRRATLARLESRIAARRAEVERLQQDERRLTRLIEKLTRELAEKARARAKAAPPAQPGAFAHLKGTLRLPVEGVIGNRFGAPRPETGIAWKGIFIRAPEGAPVKALADGRVVFADWLRGFGNLLIIDHGDGYMSLYGYNQSLYKQTGDKVAAGQVVSAAGDTGGQGESGLYFEVRYQGKPVDPLQWIGRR